MGTEDRRDLQLLHSGAGHPHLGPCLGAFRAVVTAFVVLFSSGIPSHGRQGLDISLSWGLSGLWARGNSLFSVWRIDDENSSLQVPNARLCGLWIYLALWEQE